MIVKFTCPSLHRVPITSKQFQKSIIYWLCAEEKTIMTFSSPPELIPPWTSWKIIYLKLTMIWVGFRLSSVLPFVLCSFSAVCCLLWSAILIFSAIISFLIFCCFQHLHTVSSLLVIQGVLIQNIDQTNSRFPLGFITLMKVKQILFLIWLDKTLVRFQKTTYNMCSIFENTTIAIRPQSKLPKNSNHYRDVLIALWGTKIIKELLLPTT